MSRSLEVAVSYEPDNERLVEVYAWTYNAGTRDYFSAAMEQWYPGDPAEFTIEGARWMDTGEELTGDEWSMYGERIEDSAYELAIEN